MAGMNVELSVSDPWDFCTVHGTGSFAGTITAVGRDSQVPGKEAILIRLKPTLTDNGKLCEYFIASPRLESGDLKALASGGEVFCSLTMISADRATSLDPFDLSCWRGGIALIGAIRKEE